MTIYHTQTKQSQLQFVENFLNKNTKRYIFGHNQYSKSIINALFRKNLTIEAIVDDFTNETFYKDSKNMKIPIIKMQSLNPVNKIMIVVAVTSQTKKAINKIKNLNNLNIDFIDYFAFEAINRQNKYLDLLELEFFDEFSANKNHTNISTWKDFRNDFSKNKFKYEQIYNSFADIESKNQFEKICNFRLSSNWDFMKDFEFIPEKQYWEDFLSLENIKTFFDIGAYCGETTLEFIKRVKNYKQIYFFEPEKNNFNKAFENLKQYKNIKGFNIGISDKKEQLIIESNSTSSHLSQPCSTNTKDFIQVDTLDNLLENKQITLNGGGSC